VGALEGNAFPIAIINDAKNCRIYMIRPGDRWVYEKPSGGTQRRRLPSRGMPPGGESDRRFNQKAIFRCRLAAGAAGTDRLYSPYWLGSAGLFRAQASGLDGAISAAVPFTMVVERGE
jgi:hypothetical protein